MRLTGTQYSLRHQKNMHARGRCAQCGQLHRHISQITRRLA